MGDDKNNPDQKKGFPGSIILLFLGLVFLFFMMQNYQEAKEGKVSFSYQLEHLVNLDLLDKGSSKKQPANDSLILFKGKFKDQLSASAHDRYAFLSALHKHQELFRDQSQVRSDLSTLKSDVLKAGHYFVNIASIRVPSSGYTIFSSSDPTSDYSLVLSPEGRYSGISIDSVEKSYRDYYSSEGSSAKQQALHASFQGLYSAFSSSALGIAKVDLKESLNEIRSLLAKDWSERSQALAYGKEAISQFKGLINRLTTYNESGGFRLSGLRSVMEYEQYYGDLLLLDKQYAANEIQLDKYRDKVKNVIWFFNNKEVTTRALESETNPEIYNQWFQNASQEWSAFDENKGLAFSANYQPNTIVTEKNFQSEEPAPNYFSYFLTLLPILILLFLLYSLFSRQVKGVGSSAMSFGKSRAKMLMKGAMKITFEDVAGIVEAKEELTEVVDFLKDPTKFTRLGAEIPKGVLLVGEPGTGKTLIAKAVAGEADRPFFSISGSDFVEMFVGVGASRIRDLFEQAKKSAPCIVFIDEIDAVGRHRGAGIGGGHDEREQTLNQLLVEMDGFDTNAGVILMAATNRPDVLDRALLRPGRFDRSVYLDLPDVRGRFGILNVHARKIKLADDVDMMKLARATSGMSGADLKNVLNESALYAARMGHSSVTEKDTLAAIDKVRFGKEKKSMEVDKDQKVQTAYHESGHAVVALTVPGSDPVEKVTIIPRGMSLGATHFIPEKQRLGYWQKELIDQMAVLMGGRVAEEIFLGDRSSGAQMDISQATKLARSMVCNWGMSSLGLVDFEEQQENRSYSMQGANGKKYSDETAQKIDAEVKKIIDDGYNLAHKILTERKDEVELMTKMLLEFESLDKEDIQKIHSQTWDPEEKRKKMLKEGPQDLKSIPPIDGESPEPSF